jgi:hypothetical protein
MMEKWFPGNDLIITLCILLCVVTVAIVKACN